jgi:hypothetical protein
MPQTDHLVTLFDDSAADEEVDEADDDEEGAACSDEDEPDGATFALLRSTLNSTASDSVRGGGSLPREWKVNVISLALHSCSAKR